ncbi:hypothetical protein RI367_007780 [Sorochytrium milnesiophthora]
MLNQQEAAPTLAQLWRRLPLELQTLTISFAGVPMAIYFRNKHALQPALRRDMVHANDAEQRKWWAAVLATGWTEGARLLLDAFVVHLPNICDRDKKEYLIPCDKTDRWPQNAEIVKMLFADEIFTEILVEHGDIDALKVLTAGLPAKVKLTCVVPRTAKGKRHTVAVLDWLCGSHSLNFRQAVDVAVLADNAEALAWAYKHDTDNCLKALGSVNDFVKAGCAEILQWIHNTIGLSCSAGCPIPDHLSRNSCLKLCDPIEITAQDALPIHQHLDIVATLTKHAPQAVARVGQFHCLTAVKQAFHGTTQEVLDWFWTHHPSRLREPDVWGTPYFPSTQRCSVSKYVIDRLALAHRRAYYVPRAVYDKFTPAERITPRLREYFVACAVITGDVEWLKQLAVDYSTPVHSLLDIGAGGPFQHCLPHHLSLLRRLVAQRLITPSSNWIDWFLDSGNLAGAAWLLREVKVAPSSESARHCARLGFLGLLQLVHNIRPGCRRCIVGCDWRCTHRVVDAWWSKQQPEPRTPCADCANRKTTEPTDISEWLGSDGEPDSDLNFDLDSLHDDDDDEQYASNASPFD